MIPFLTIIFVIIIAILTYQLKKTTQEQNDVDERFWEREREANATRKKDISNLDYITIPEGLFPLNLGSDTESKISTFTDKQMLNLTGITNTDLKLEYGMQNLDFLTECDDNFSQLVRIIPDYVRELLAANQTDDARNILEFAVNNLADSRAIFELLSGIYVEDGQIDKVSDLISVAEKLNSLSKNTIINDLNEVINVSKSNAVESVVFEQAAEIAKKSKYIVDDDEEDDYSFLR